MESRRTRTTAAEGSVGYARTSPWRASSSAGSSRRTTFLNDLYAEGLFRGFLALFEIPDTAAQLYRVIRTDGTQVGAFRVRENAFRAWRSVDGDAVIRNREGRDVTAEIVAEHGFAVPAPVGTGDGGGDAAAPVDDDFIPLEHPVEADEEPPQLEPVDEEAESFEEGLVGAPQ